MGASGLDAGNVVHLDFTPIPATKCGASTCAGDLAASIQSGQRHPVGLPNFQGGRLLLNAPAASRCASWGQELKRSAPSRFICCTASIPALAAQRVKKTPPHILNEVLDIVATATGMPI